MAAQCLFKENAMTMKLKWRLAMAPVLVAAALGWGSARADEIPLVTGQQWSQSTEQVKKVYLIGMTNAFQVEAAYQVGNAPSDAQSAIPRMVKGLNGQTLDSVREALDRWYAANPARLQRPVIETIWFEIVVPGLKTNK
jgi:hypothetical protein